MLSGLTVLTVASKHATSKNAKRRKKLLPGQNLPHLIKDNRTVVFSHAEVRRQVNCIYRLLNHVEVRTGKNNLLESQSCSFVSRRYVISEGTVITTIFEASSIILTSYKTHA